MFWKALSACLSQAAGLRWGITQYFYLVRLLHYSILLSCPAY